MNNDGAGPSSLDSAPSYAGSWSKLKPPLHPILQDHITSTLQFTQMTPVQSSVIPLFLSHRDVIVEAVTGSGKTLAYALPVLQMMLRRNERDEDRFRKGQVGALIICPTRELAVQVHGVLNDFVRTQPIEEEATVGEPSHSSLSGALLAVGGSSSSPADDYKRFKEQGCNIIVGTPGRVEELLKRPGIDVKELEVLILDEADRLLDLGFSLTLQTILQLLPKQRRTGLFSATMTDALGELARIGLRNPVRVVVKVESKRMKGSQQTTDDRRMPASLQNHYLVCRAENKVIQLIRLLRREAFHPGQGNAVRKAIVYFSTCAQVDYFSKVLSKVKEMSGIRIYSLHGQQTPSRRTTTFESFVSATPMGQASSSEAVSVLFCTDVAARGLDLPNVDLVIQFDPPTDPKVFSHRCGRTARAGRHGRAVIFLLKGREEDYIDFLKIRKSPVKSYPYLINEREGGPEPDENANQSDKGASQLTKEMRKIIHQDRDLYESSVKAFVSYIKCYKKHEVNFIFREKDLNFAKIGTSFALLRLPRMPEIDRWRKDHKEEWDQFDGEEHIDMDTFAYADKGREKQRLEALEKKKAEREEEAKSSSLTPASKRRKMRGTIASETAWSHQKAKKERKEERKEKKAAKRAFDKKQRQIEEGEGKPTAMLDEADEKEDDWALDEREAKRARKGKGDETFTDSHFDDL